MIPYKKYKISVIKVIKKATSNEGHRMCLYPEKPKGRIHDLRTWFSFVLLIILFTGPYIKAKGNPSLLFNIMNRKFSILEQISWPQDSFFCLGNIGVHRWHYRFHRRVWMCKACPRTLLMEMVFRKIRRLD
mgnify:FL=1